MRSYSTLALAFLGLVLVLPGCSCGGSSRTDDPDAGPDADTDTDTDTDTDADTDADAGTDGGVDYPQDPDRCGDEPPAFDVATRDPFAGERYSEPDPDMVPPFSACAEALADQMALRTPCSEVGGRRTLLVTTDADDPRWEEGSFDARFDTIQAAIDAANHCDTLIVRPGTYREYLRIAEKDVQIFSDTWNEDVSAEDGDERVPDYEAERIDLLHYYETGERVVTETRETYLQPLRRAVRTILAGGGYDEGPTRGGTIEVDLDDPGDPNRGCGNRRPMVDFVGGTTRNTIFDGFTVRLMPQQEHMMPGHGHTLQCRGGSPVIRHNIVYDNGSTGIGVHASFLDTTPTTPPCEHEPSLEQETFRNGDYRHTNVAFRPVPLVYDNIAYQNNGLGLGNNHYSCATMVNNESFWNAVPGEEATHSSPGIGVRHGAKVLIEYGIAYFNVAAGISPGTSTYDYNLLSGNNGQPASCEARACRMPQYVGSSPGPNDLFEDPLFTDGAAFDFTLQAGSPAVDSGTDISDYYSGWPMEGAGPDRGSHER